MSENKTSDLDLRGEQPALPQDRKNYGGDFAFRRNFDDFKNVLQKRCPNQLNSRQIAIAVPPSSCPAHTSRRGYCRKHIGRGG